MIRLWRVWAYQKDPEFVNASSVGPIPTTFVIAKTKRSAVAAVRAGWKYGPKWAFNGEEVPALQGKDIT